MTYMITLRTSKSKPTPEILEQTRQLAPKLEKLRYEIATYQFNIQLDKLTPTNEFGLGFYHHILTNLREYQSLVHDIDPIIISQAKQMLKKSNDNTIMSKCLFRLKGTPKNHSFYLISN